MSTFVMKEYPKADFNFDSFKKLSELGNVKTTVLNSFEILFFQVDVQQILFKHPQIYVGYSSDKENQNLRIIEMSKDYGSVIPDVEIGLIRMADGLKSLYPSGSTLKDFYIIHNDDIFQFSNFKFYVRR